MLVKENYCFAGLSSLHSISSAFCYQVNNDGNLDCCCKLVHRQDDLKIRLEKTTELLATWTDHIKNHSSQIGQICQIRHNKVSNAATVCSVAPPWTASSAWTALTLVSLLRASFSCSIVQPSHGGPSVSLLCLCPQFDAEFISASAMVQGVVYFGKFLAVLEKIWRLKNYWASHWQL